MASGYDEKTFTNVFCILQSGPGLCVNFDVILLSVSYVNTMKVPYQRYEVTFTTSGM